MKEFKAASAAFEKMKGDPSDLDVGRRALLVRAGQARRGRRRVREVPRHQVPDRPQLRRRCPRAQGAEGEGDEALQRLARAARPRSARGDVEEVRATSSRSRTTRTRSRRPPASVRSCRSSATQLFTAEIPAEVRKSQIIDGYDLAQDKVDSYCDALTTAAEPLADKSLNAYGACLSKSTELGWFSEWSKLCERELGQIKPEEFPTASELRGDPNQVSPVITVEPPARLE